MRGKGVRIVCVFYKRLSLGYNCDVNICTQPSEKFFIITYRYHKRQTPWTFKYNWFILKFYLLKWCSKENILQILIHVCATKQSFNVSIRTCKFFKTTIDALILCAIHQWKNYIFILTFATFTSGIVHWYDEFKVIRFSFLWNFWLIIDFKLLASNLESKWHHLGYSIILCKLLITCSLLFQHLFPKT